MTKKEFLEICDIAIKEKKGIILYVDIPGNKHYEHIANNAEDVETKKKYYDITYDENMSHKHAPVVIVGAKPFDVMPNPKF